jgi:polysaccharide pyruvyl transferase WcaK-like protein
MRVLHSYCLNYNIGDYALGMGVKNLLRETFDIDLIGETNIQGREFNKYYINEVVNKKYDLLVIGGGGIIHGAHWPNGWFWLIEKDLIKSIKIPFVIYGVGNNYFEDEAIPERAVAHLQETYKYAKYFSVRNDESYERVVSQVGFKPAEIPDPGFHVGLNKSYEKIIEEPYVIVQLANDKTKQRFKNKKLFIDGMKFNVAKLAKNYKIIFIPHVLDDVAISNEICDGIDNAEVLKFGNFAFDHADKMIGYYKYAEFVIAMRGHGQIVPIGFNVPVLSLQNHPKHIGLMRKLELEDYNVHVNDSKFSEHLRDGIIRMINNKEELKKKYSVINKRLISESQTAMSDIRSRLKDVSH